MDRNSYQSLKEQVIAYYDIKEVLHQELGDPKRGGFYPCPFHPERTPSFHAHPTEQIVYCFGSCQKAWNVIDFISELRGWEFNVALKYLAENAGIRINTSPRERERTELKRGLYEIVDFSAKLYRDDLENSDSDEAREAREYLRSRKISDETRRKFGLGYAPDAFKWLTSRLSQNKFRLENAVQAGILSKDDEGFYYDFFRGRVMIPISDTRGRVIGFGGRLLRDYPNQEEVKYFNSRRGEIYNKEEALLGINHACKSARRTGIVYIVEGYFDFLHAQQQGIENVIATCGTALTEEHVKVIQRYFKDSKVVLVFDGDKGGIDGAMRSGLNLFGDVQTSVCLLPIDNDPANLAESGEDLTKHFENNTPFSIFYFKQLMKKFDLKPYEGIYSFLGQVAREAFIRVPVGSTNAFIDGLHNTTGIRVETIKEKFMDHERRFFNQNLGFLETALLSSLFSADPEVLHQIPRIPLRFFSSDESRAFMKYLEARDRNGLNYGPLFDPSQEELEEEVSQKALAENIHIDSRKLSNQIKDVLKRRPYKADINSVAVNAIRLVGGRTILLDSVNELIREGVSPLILLNRLLNLKPVLSGIER